MITVKESFSKRIELLVALLVLSPLIASAMPMNLLGEGMLFSSPEVFVEVADISAVSEPEVPFFKPLDPGLSEIGSVKTYSLKLVKANSSNDWGQIKKQNKESLKKNSKCLIRPVHGRISSLFGRRRHPTKQYWHFHAGIDIVARTGTPILAGMGGKVSYAGWKRGYGLMLIVEHNDGFETVYAHCSRILVKKGEIVSAGQKIAKVGSTGVATGSHLHFEVRRDGHVRNPFRYLAN